MSEAETKPDVKPFSGAPPVESGPGETNNLKVMEQATQERPAENEVDQNNAVKTEENQLAAAGLKPSSEALDKVAVEAVDVDKKVSVGEREEKIVQDAVKQITFYLSDSNLPYDKFLFMQAQKTVTDTESSLGTGWIPLSTILSFKRMQEIISKSSRSATICEFAIVNALRSAYPNSEKDALLEVSEHGDEIRRKKELVPPSQTGQMDRSIYAKNFPEEEQVKEDSGRNGREHRNGKKDYDFSYLQKELEDFFGRLGLGKVNAVRMRRDDKKTFKGSVFVEWATLESSKAFLELDPLPTFPGQKESLEVMSKKAYVDMKAKEKGIPAVYAANKDASKNDSSRSRNDNAKRPFNAFRGDWKTGGSVISHKRHKYDDDSDDDKKEGTSSKIVKVFVEGKELEVDEETGNLKNPEEMTYTSGKVARFEGASTSDDSNPLSLKNNLQSVHPAAYVDFECGNSTGIVFFKEAVSEEKMQVLESAKLTLGGDDFPLTWTIIKDDEEKQFHLNRANKRASIALADAKSGKSRGGERRDNRDSSRGRGRGRGRGSRGNNHGGHRDGRDSNSNRDRRDGRDNRNGKSKGSREDRDSGKRGRDDDDDVKPKAEVEQKGQAIQVPAPDSNGPASGEPDAKRVKTDA